MVPAACSGVMQSASKGLSPLCCAALPAATEAPAAADLLLHSCCWQQQEAMSQLPQQRLPAPAASRSQVVTLLALCRHIRPGLSEPLLALLRLLLKLLYPSTASRQLQGSAVWLAGRVLLSRGAVGLPSSHSLLQLPSLTKSSSRPHSSDSLVLLSVCLSVNAVGLSVGFMAECGLAVRPGTLTLEGGRGVAATFTIGCCCCCWTGSE